MLAAGEHRLQVSFEHALEGLHGLPFGVFRRERPDAIEGESAAIARWRHGLLVPHPPETPFTLEWQTSSQGIGLSLDFGVTFAAINRWDFGVGASGVANRIKWHDITRHELALVSLFNGTEFVHTKLPRTGLTTQVELPVTYTSDLSYHRDKWSAYTEYSNGLGGTNFRAGLEYRLSRVELRGAGRYSQGHWYPDTKAWERHAVR